MCKRTCLVLHFDEASPNLAMGQWLLHKVGVRALLVRDVYHREWNDATLALPPRPALHMIDLPPSA